MIKFLLPFLLVPFIGFAQKTTIDLPIDEATNKISFTKVVEAPGSKHKIFELLRTWSTTTSDIKEKNIKVADSTSGEIVVECKQPIFSLGVSFCYVKYSITFYVKDNKYKSIIRSFNHEGCNRGDGYGIMPSYGALETMLDVQKDRKYLDHILSATKDHAQVVQGSFEKYSLTAKSEKDF